jgi:hypothetical protein
MDASELEPDPDVTAERTPTACPFCGYDGAFDGHGRFTDEVTIIHAGVEQTFRQQVASIRCPDCNGRFDMRGEATEVEE